MLTPYIWSQVPSSSPLWQFSLASPSLSFLPCKMSGATTTKVVWFGEGWDELEQRLAHRAWVKWHVLFLLSIVSAFRVSQSPDKTHAMMREELIRRNDVVSKPQGRQSSDQFSIFPCRSNGEGFGMETGLLWRKGGLWGLRKRFLEEVMPC